MNYYLMLIKHAVKVACRECVEIIFKKLAKKKWRFYAKK